MKKEMLINVLQPEECRIAIVENGVLEELYVERTSHESYTGNIYKGKVVNLEPAIQAAFVDFSVGRNGFLHVSDVEPQYYERHQQPGDDGGLTGGPSGGPPSRPRDRESRRERERDDRRRARPDPLADPFAPPPPPSRSEERYRERDRDRERPDRSVKGRRDRSEMPRRFGEGLTEDQESSAPPPASPEPTVQASPESRYRHEETSTSDWTGSVESAWDDLEVDRSREIERDRPRDRGYSSHDADESKWRASGSPEPYDPELPPSRTQRSHSFPTAPPSPEIETHEPERYRTGSGSEPPSAEREPGLAEGRGFGSAAPREARRGRGRGRPSVPPPPRSLPGFEEETSPTPEIGVPRERYPEPEELSGSGEEASHEEPPRRRGGRAAIRSRGGERSGEPERIREIPPSPEPERTSRPIEREHERYRGVESTRLGEPVRGRSGETPELPRERMRPHARAGEPGYVPRRERLRAADQEYLPEAEAPSFGWREPAGEPELDIESREFLEAEEETRTEPEAPAPRDARRRRRRRGRRRDRERSEIETARPAEAEPLAAEFNDLKRDSDYSEPFARGLAAEELGGEEIEDLELDLDELEDEGDIAIEEEESLAAEEGVLPARLPEEEIDPELEQEIRKEIEEIEVLEREMGLRGPVEARPRRGDEAARAGRAGRGRGLAKPPIQEIFRRGDEVLVQVIKESIGTKGPTLSTYISIPGRYLVLMPGLNRVGVSRKIVDEGQRRKLREIMHELNPPKGLGFIVRTAGLERTKRELARDLAYLLRLWKVILRRIKRTKGPGPIYQESDMITRTIRDIFTSEIDTIWIDEPSAFERAQEFLRVVMPRFVNRIKLYDEKVPLFYKYGIEDEIAKIQRRHVPLPEGGSIVIDQTEALVAIDVNSGNFRVEDDAERTAYEMNLRAAKEIARQLRLRDLGGVIVNDFIDMREERHRRGVERALRDAIKRDRARTKILRMSAFGLIEMTRQRIRPSLKRSIYEDCTHCAGAGVVKTAESMAIDVMRLLALASHRDDIRRIAITVSPGVATYLNNRKRKEIARMETDSGMAVQILMKENSPAEFLQIECFDANSSEVRLIPLPAPGHKRGH